MTSSDALIRLIVTASADRTAAYCAAQAGHLPVDMRCGITLSPVAMIGRIDRQGLAG